MPTETTRTADRTTLVIDNTPRIRFPALTLWRPWPSFIVAMPPSRAKNIENRPWTTSYRGWFWAHAGKAIDEDAFDFATTAVGGPESGWEVSTDPADHPTGIIGFARIFGICAVGLGTFGSFNSCDCGPWAVGGEAHWKVVDGQPLAEPVPCRGYQKLWNPPRAIEQRCIDLLTPSQRELFQRPQSRTGTVGTTPTTFVSNDGQAL
jgi:hypothetical protein